MLLLNRSSEKCQMKSQFQWEQPDAFEEVRVWKYRIICAAGLSDTVVPRKLI